MLVVASGADRPGDHATAVEEAEVVGVDAVRQPNVASQHRVVPAGHDEAWVPLRLAAQHAVQSGVRPLARRADDGRPDHARFGWKLAQHTADPIGEAAWVRAVVRAEADD